MRTCTHCGGPFTTRASQCRRCGAPKSDEDLRLDLARPGDRSTVAENLVAMHIVQERKDREALATTQIGSSSTIFTAVIALILCMMFPPLFFLSPILVPVYLLTRGRARYDV